MKFIFIVLFSIALCLQSKAQDYTTAMGVRLGTISGIKYKKFITDEKANTLFMSFRGNGVQLTVLKEFHQPILLNSTSQLFFFFGYGGHIGYSNFRNETEYYNGKEYQEKGFSVMFGFDVVIGFEYHLIKYPLTINLDLKPFAEFNLPWYVRTDLSDFGINLLYTF